MQRNNNQKENRLYFLDNLRTFVIYLVIVFHVGYIYEDGGLLSPVWIVDDPSKNSLAGYINWILDILMMPILFFISGYFASRSIQSKPGWSFLASRFKRLMIPWFMAALTLLPMFKILYLVSRNLPQSDFLSYFHFSGGLPINQGWLWFLPVLFLFDVSYLLISTVTPVSLKPGLKMSTVVVFLMGFIYSFCLSYYGYTGWTVTVLLDFQNERLLVYFLIFLLGAVCNRISVFESPPTGKVLYCCICFVALISTGVYINFWINFFIIPGPCFISEIIDLILVWIAFYLSMMSLVYLFISTFRIFLNKSGKIADGLNKHSFGVYIIHLIVLGSIALVLRDVSLPSILKYTLVAVSSIIISNLIVYFYKLWVHSILQYLE